MIDARRSPSPGRSSHAERDRCASSTSRAGPTADRPRRYARRRLSRGASQRRRGPAHAGTLDPFATGLLLLLSGAATRLQPRFVGLPKRYLTEIDLRSRTSTGDLDGEAIEEHEPPTADELEEALAGLRGAVELPVPAASAIKIEGERAYALHRRGVAGRDARSHDARARAAARVVSRSGSARLDLLVSSGTYVRSIADALGGHCASLRRTEIGPFRIEEADPELILDPDSALARVERL